MCGMESHKCQSGRHEKLWAQTDLFVDKARYCRVGLIHKAFQRVLDPTELPARKSMAAQVLHVRYGSRFLNADVAASLMYNKFSAIQALTIQRGICNISSDLT